MRFETRFTYDFVRRFLPQRPQRILEVGCGTGELASRLLQDGCAVVAIDSDHDSVVAARQLGVDASVGRILTMATFTQFFSLARSIIFIHSIKL